MSSYPATHNYAFYQGDTIRRSLRWANAGVPVDLAGYTARIQVRRHIDAAEVALELTTDAGITLGEAGSITFTVDAPATKALAPWVYAYSLELTSSGGEVTTLIRGGFEITQEVTR